MAFAQNRGYVKHAMMAFLMPSNSLMATIAESTTYPGHNAAREILKDW